MSSTKANRITNGVLMDNICTHQTIKAVGCKVGVRFLDANCKVLVGHERIAVADQGDPIALVRSDGAGEVDGVVSRLDGHCPQGDISNCVIHEEVKVDVHLTLVLCNYHVSFLQLNYLAEFNVAVLFVPNGAHCNLALVKVMCDGELVRGLAIDGCYQGCR